MNDMNKLSAMCERKTADIMAQGYAKTGYVLMMADPAADICVSDHGAVSWFTRDQWNWLMHNRDHVEFAWPKPVGAAVAPAAPVVTVGTAEFWEVANKWAVSRFVSTNEGIVTSKALIAHIDADKAAAVASEQRAKEAAIQQAQQHAMEARTQRGMVLDILRHFGCPEEDWHALELIKDAHEKEVAEAVERAQASAPVAATEELRKKLMFAAIDCGHIISDNEITLYADENKGGNALHQLTERLVSAALAAPQQHAQAALSDEQIMEIWEKADTPSRENNWTTGPTMFARALFSAVATQQGEKGGDL
jgi:hypothetical protein